MFYKNLGEFVDHLHDDDHRRQELQLQRNQVESIAKLAAELEALRRDLASTKEELARYQAQQSKQREADAVQAELDRNKVFRHEYRVAGFAFLLAFIAERICNLAQLDEIILKWVTSLFQ